MRQLARPAAFVKAEGDLIDIYGEISPFEGGISARSISTGCAP